MPPISSFREFLTALDGAIAGMKSLIEKFPGDAFLESILRQITIVREWMQAGKWPNSEERRKLSFGVMASKAVDELDPDLAQLLYRIANFIDQQAPVKRD
jgi:hypothetical protein